MNMQGFPHMSERLTAVPLSYRADGVPERFAFQFEASNRISTGSTAYGTSLTAPPGSWTLSSEASAAPHVPRAGCWGCSGCPPSPMGCPSDPVLHDLNVHDRRAMAPPELHGSDDEVEEEEEDDDDYGAFPLKMLLYPATDDEGEPQEKAAWELWPVPAPKPKRNYAHSPTAVLAQPSGLPSPGTRVRVILGTRPREAKQQAPGQAAPPVVVRRPPGIHALPAARGTAAAPATAAGAPPPGVHGAPVGGATVAASAAATGVAAARAPAAAPTAQETQAQAAHEWRASRRARRANQPRITTLVVRNLHTLTSQQEFLDEVNCSGFAEKYDFAYLPRGFEDGCGKGHAFVNFKTPEAASTFAAAWHRSRRLCEEDETGQPVPLNVSNASQQGLEANLRKWTDARVTRIKNPDFLPFVLGGAEPEPAATAVIKPR